MRYALAALGLALTPLAACGQANGPDATPEIETPHARTLTAAEALDAYDGLLRNHVSAAGDVDYAAIAAEPAALNAYVLSLSETGPADKAPAPERLAHLINAYNAFTLKLIVDAAGGGDLPASIMDLEGGKPWDAVDWNLGGRTVSLNQIEHELIRPVFDEPRIHWALVCAAYSCPPLRSEAYRPDRLEAQLASQEGYVLNFDHPRYATRDGGAVKVTPLFDWYGEDFVIGDAGAKAYAAERLGVEAREIDGFLDYDWKLNDIGNR